MKQYYKDNVAIPIGSPFNLNNLAFPANWLDNATPEDLESQGIVMVDAVEEVGEFIPAEPKVQTLSEKLETIGITLEELKAALA